MTSSTMRSIRTSAVLLVACGVAVLGASPVTAAAAKHKAVAFGAKITSHTQPSNSFGPTSCREDTGVNGACTRVALVAYGRPNTGQVAPKDGTIKHIKIMAGDKGSFRLEIAQANPSTQKAKIVVRGPLIHYVGQGGIDNGGPYTVETFPVTVHVKKGEYLATQATNTSMLRCSGGGASQLLFQPVLTVGERAKKAEHHDGCFLLLEAIY